LRMALGADAWRLVRVVVSHGLTLTLAGIAVGAGAALGTTRLLGDMLYRVSPRDPLVFGSAIGVMAIAAFVACVVPAVRATRIDPLRVLRDA
jgi:putative ABC transport system permease protein